MPPRVLQSYLEDISTAITQADGVVRKRELLRSYAELQYRISGGGKCSICATHVRHVLPVTRRAHNGTLTHFPCLCTRCFEGERAAAERMSVRAGVVTMHYDREGRVTFESGAVAAGKASGQ